MTSIHARDLIGQRVRYDGSSEPDPYSPREPGATGTITHVDDAQTLHVTWDDGARLGLLPDVDRWTILPPLPDAEGDQ